MIKSLTESHEAEAFSPDAENSERDNEHLLVPANPALMFQYLSKNGWTDGLPVLAPTCKAVDDLISANGLDKDGRLGTIPPLNGIASNEKNRCQRCDGRLLA